jgi:hypothetical protein
MEDRLSNLMNEGCTQEAIDYLGNPIHVSAHMSKYKTTLKQVQHAISIGKIKGFLIDGSLWVQDRKI